MIRLLFALCLLTLANPAAAQVVVRSGAHDGFDRLVLDMPTRIEWRSELRDRSASLIFENTELRFDLDAAFARIERTRLRAVSAPGSGGRLDLDFACACRLRVFWHGDRMLVLDILDDEPAETDFQPRSASRGIVGLFGTSSMMLSAPRHSPASAALTESLRGSVGPRQSAILDRAPAGSTPALQDMSRTLLQQLGRAASQGMITISEPTRPDTTQPASPEPDKPNRTENTADQSPEATPPVADAERGSASRPALRVRTSIDRDIRPTTVTQTDRDTSESCPPADFLDLSSWGGTRPFRSQIGRLNGSLYGEFDRLNKTEALRLARLYIHHGFGAEARQALEVLGPLAPEAAILRELADVVDDVPHPGGTLADALHCGEPAVMWSLLAMPELHEDRVFDHRALKRSFGALSETLRRSLGPVLVRRLVSAGHDRTAEAVFRLIGEDRDRSGAGSEFAKAALAKRAGEPEEADAALREVVRSNGAQSGEALAERIETALHRDQPVTLPDSQLAGALAFEHRGTPLGDRLAAVYLEALGASGAFDKAIREFDRIRPSLANETVSEVAAKMIGALSNAADDVTFLRHIMTDRLATSRALPAPLVLAVAKRLLGLGFPEHALRYAGSRAPAENDRDTRLLRARAALAQGNAVEADLELLGLEGRDADILRAEARQSRGEYAAVQALFAAHDETARADRAALRVGRADAMSEAQDPLLRDVAQTLRDGLNDTPAAEGTDTTETHALLEQSADMRDVFRRLLARMPPPTSTD